METSLAGTACPTGAGDGPGSPKEKFGVFSATHKIRQISPEGKQRRCLFACWSVIQALSWLLAGHTGFGNGLAMSVGMRPQSHSVPWLQDSHGQTDGSAARQD